MNINDQPVLLFDGVCNLCNRSVGFIIRNDKKKLFRFAPRQSDYGQKALEEFSIHKQATADSIILIINGRYYERSDALFQTLRLLGMPWSLLYAGIVIPGFIRNYLYDFVARRRYKWFGKMDQCMVPAADISDRFL